MTAKPDALVFLYGTLTYPDVLRALLGRSAALRPARVEGWSVRGLSDRPYPVLVRAPADVAHGKVGAVSVSEFALMDAFEDAIYDRVRLRVVVKEETMMACAFVILDPSAIALRLTDAWDVRAFERGLDSYVRACARFAEAHRQPGRTTRG